MVLFNQTSGKPMRPTIAKFVLAVLCASASPTLFAQSLEESYAKMCSDAANAKSETCQILARSLVDKIQGQQPLPTSATVDAGSGPATQALWRKRWGYLIDFMGKEMFTVYGTPMPMDVRKATLAMRYKSEWLVPGEEVLTTMNMGDGVWHVMGTSRWDESTQRVVTTAPPPSNLVSYYSVSTDGAVIIPETTHGGITSRSTTRKIPSGQVQTVLEVKKDGVWTESMRLTGLVATPEAVAVEQQRIQLEQQQAAQQIADRQRELSDEKRAQSQQRGQMFNSILQGVAQGFSESESSGYAEAQANLDATVADIQAQAAEERRHQVTAGQAASAQQRMPAPHQPPANAMTYAAPAAPSPPSSVAAAPASAAPQASRPLRFVMSISLRNQPGDKVNPTCYSNVISRPGPPGWGAPGFLPPGSAEQARAAVYSLKADFIARCRASGREITSDGNFNFQLNQGQGDEERLQGMRARHPEDVSVSL
jgi:hypothetical protein